MQTSSTPSGKQQNTAFDPVGDIFTIESFPGKQPVRLFSNDVSKRIFLRTEQCLVSTSTDVKIDLVYSWTFTLLLHPGNH